MHLDHFALWVRDLERTRTFYETYFGAVAGERYVNAGKQFTSYFLTFPGVAGQPTDARLETMQMPTIPATANDPFTQATGFIHMAISVGGEAAVDTLTEQLRADGYTIVGEPRRTGDGYYESVVLDPEQNRIEITA